ncbi:MAG: CD3072 family TudS-related putative desulfidase [Candidatus Aenigmatarchaeota archaeon]
MKRGKKIVFVSHCLLNQNTMPVGKASFAGSVKDLLELFAESGVGIVQLECPQMEFNNGLDRRPATKGSYENNGFKQNCQKMSSQVLERIETYMKKDYKVLGIIGVEFSKTCGVHQVRNGRRSTPGKGIFMEELELEMQKKNFQVPMIGVNLNNVYSSIDKIQSLLKFT